ncbi:hypothetical protein Aperf_G00000084274 [Anoplocephala perfoliata]
MGKAGREVADASAKDAPNVENLFVTLPGCGKAVKGLGKGGAKRHRKTLRDNIQGITKPAIRRLARRGGVKRTSDLIYEETRGVPKVFLENVTRDAVIYTEQISNNTSDLISQIKKLKKSQLASKQPSMQRYKSIVKKAVSEKFETAERKRVFRQAKTDFQRICFLLQAFKSSRKGFEQLIQLAMSEEIEEINGKSDRKSELFRLYSAVAWNSKGIDVALSASTNAVFYAVSPKQKALAFARRCNILYNLGLIKEAILDGEYALRFPCPQDEAGHIHLCLGECFRILNNISEARRHFELAISKLTRKEEAGQSELLSRAQQGLTHCTVEMTEIERPPSWQSFRPQPPQLVKRWTELSSDDLTEEKSEEISCRLLSSPKGLLGLKYMGQKIGWSLQLKKDISADVTTSFLVEAVPMWDFVVSGVPMML